MLRAAARGLSARGGGEHQFERAADELRDADALPSCVELGGSNGRLLIELAAERGFGPGSNPGEIVA
jgi:hypothetical protein